MASKIRSSKTFRAIAATATLGAMWLAAAAPYWQGTIPVHH